MSLTHRVIPTLEANMRSLHEAVSSARKVKERKRKVHFMSLMSPPQSFKGLRAWLRPFGSSAPPPSVASAGVRGGDGALGTAILTRRLADTLFVLKDIEAALTNYKLCQNDFKTEKQVCEWAWQWR